MLSSEWIEVLRETDPEFVEQMERNEQNLNTAIYLTNPEAGVLWMALLKAHPDATYGELFAMMPPHLAQVVQDVTTRYYRAIIDAFDATLSEEERAYRDAIREEIRAAKREAQKKLN